MVADYLSLHWLGFFGDPVSFVSLCPGLGIPQEGGRMDSTYFSFKGKSMMDRSKDWIDEAERDLQHAKSDIMGGYYNWACFSAQQ